MVAVPAEEAAWGLKSQPQAPHIVYQPSVPMLNPAEPDTDDDSLAILPRGTVVHVRGNARTRSNLVGQVATVKKAAGLGGWHFLVLPSGEEVKLQRNALEVLERPSGNQQDFSEEEEEEQQRRQQQQQEAAARGYPYEPAEPHGEDRPRPRRQQSLQQLQQRSLGGGAGGGGVVGGGSMFGLEEYSSGPRTRPPSSRTAGGHPRINLNKLQTAALKRYGTVYHLPEAEQQATREQLLGAVSEHFAAQQVDENEVIACFLNAVRRHRMGLQR